MKAQMSKKLIAANLRKQLQEKEENFQHGNVPSTHYKGYMHITSQNDHKWMEDTLWSTSLLSDFYIKGSLTGFRGKTYYYDVGMHEGIKQSKSDLNLLWSASQQFKTKHLYDIQLVFKMKEFCPGFLDATDYCAIPIYRNKLINILTLYESFQMHRPVLGQCVRHTENGSVIVLGGGLLASLPDDSYIKVRTSESQIVHEKMATKTLTSNKKVSLNSILLYTIDVFDLISGYCQVSLFSGKAKPRALSSKVIQKRVLALRKHKKLVADYIKYKALLTKPVNSISGSFAHNFLIREGIQKRLTGQKLSDYFKKRNKV